MLSNIQDICYTVPPKPGEQLTKAEAGYSDEGPFGCGNCTWFQQLPDQTYDGRTRGNCEVVGYPVAKQGCCDFWHGDGTPEHTTPLSQGMQKVEYVEVTNAHYTCSECIFFDSIRFTCWPVKGPIGADASCNKWMPNYSAIAPSSMLQLPEYAALRQSIRQGASDALAQS